MIRNFKNCTVAILAKLCPTSRKKNYESLENFQWIKEVRCVKFPRFCFQCTYLYISSSGCAGLNIGDSRVLECPGERARVKREKQRFLVRLCIITPISTYTRNSEKWSHVML